MSTHYILFSIPNLQLWCLFQGTRGRLSGAMVLGKLPVPGRPSNLADSRARAYGACSGCRWGLFGHFYSIVSLLFRPVFGRRPDID